MASAEEVEKLADALQLPAFRRSFHDDPVVAMQNANVTAQDIPQELLDTLNGLSLLELGVIARVNRELVVLKGNEVMMRMPV